VRGHPAPDWIKVDVEGGEGAVFRGARRLLREAAPALLIELHGPESAADVWDVLRGVGYLVFDLSGRPLREPGNVAWKAYVSAFAVDWEEGRLRG
jgi:hypothetical protein